MTKRMKLPKEGLVEPESRRPSGDPFMDEGDVEGHGLPTTAPPSLARRDGGEGVLNRRSPGHGGEAIPRAGDEDDVEGQRFR